MKFFRWAIALFLLLIGLLLCAGAYQIAAHLRPGTALESAFDAAIALALGAGAWLLVRKDLSGRTLRGFLSDPRIRVNPAAHAVVAYVCAALVMLAAPKYSLAPAFVAICAYSVSAAIACALRRRWFLHAVIAIVAWVILLGALDMTAEALSPKSIGEGGMVFLLPMMGFPVLLAVSGIVRWQRREAVLV
jgi:hypothetical protein